jgi:hypothetical protein
MRAPSLLLGALALAGGASCSALHRFHDSAPGLADGAWRLGGFAGGLGESSEVNSADDESSSLGLDLGKVIGDSGEFGLRVASTDFDVSGADVVVGGPYLRWYFPGVLSLRPLVEASGGIAGIDYGPGDDTGWSLSAGAGAMLVLARRVALEAVVRQSYGDFETGDDTSVTELAAGVSIFW